MRKSIATVLLAGLGLIGSMMPLAVTAAHAEDGNTDVKEWTMLVYLNGHNNLDSFGSLNINQMEQIGSSKDLNILVQWASAANSNTQRLLVKRDNSTQTVTSPVIQSLGKVDMGDWHSLVDFVQWAVTNYPAKHYFIDVWDHGSGWHAIKLNNLLASQPDRSPVGGSFEPMDISWDDDSGNHITTAQLGLAMAESARIIGHKVDLYASDACLMAMAEVANEMADSVEIYAGSEEVEPGAGWPYQTFLKRWAARPAATAAEVGSFLAEEYVKSYSGGVNGTSDVTYSVFDLSKLPALTASVADLGAKLLKLDANGRKSILAAAGRATNFDFSDYVDLGDFLSQLDDTRVVDSSLTAAVRSATNDFVVSNHDTAKYSKAKGVSLWIPTSKYTFDSYSTAYRGMQFDRATHWADALAYLMQDASSRH